MAKPTRPQGRDVTDIVREIYDFGFEGVTTTELRSVIAWLLCEIDSRRASRPPSGADDAR